MPEREAHCPKQRRPEGRQLPARHRATKNRAGKFPSNNFQKKRAASKVFFSPPTAPLVGHEPLPTVSSTGEDHQREDYPVSYCPLSQEIHQRTAITFIALTSFAAALFFAMEKSRGFPCVENLLGRVKC